MLITFVLLCLSLFGMWYLYKDFERGKNWKYNMDPDKNTNFLDIEFYLHNNEKEYLYVVFDERKPACIGPHTCTWDTSVSRYAVHDIKSKRPKFEDYRQTTSNIFKMKNNQILSIALPQDYNTKLPFWKNAEEESPLTFTITRINPESESDKKIQGTKFEVAFDSNESEIVYGISCKDGVNVDAEIAYFNNKTLPQNEYKRRCNLGSCPAEFTSYNGVCLNPKIDPETLKKRGPLYSCSSGEEIKKCIDFWMKDELASSWVKYINNGGVNAKCQSYSWKYDNKSLNTKNQVVPNMKYEPVHSKLAKGGTLRAKITRVFN